MLMTSHVYIMIQNICTFPYYLCCNFWYVRCTLSSLNFSYRNLTRWKDSLYLHGYCVAQIFFYIIFIFIPRSSALVLFGHMAVGYTCTFTNVTGATTDALANYTQTILLWSSLSLTYRSSGTSVSPLPPPPPVARHQNLNTLNHILI